MYSCDGFCGKKVAAVPDDLHFIEKTSPLFPKTSKNGRSYFAISRQRRICDSLNLITRYRFSAISCLSLMVS